MVRSALHSSAATPMPRSMPAPQPDRYSIPQVQAPARLTGERPPDAVQRGTIMAEIERRPPVPPFTRETAIQKVRAAEDAWNTRQPERVSLAYTPQSKWRNRSEFPVGRAEIVTLLQRKWARE